MVPFVFGDNEGEVREVSLPLVAEVEHMRNGYSSMPGIPLARLHVEAAIQGVFQPQPSMDTASTTPPTGESGKPVGEQARKRNEISILYIEP